MYFVCWSSRVLLWSLGWPGAQSIDQAVPRLWGVPTSAFQYCKRCVITTPSLRCYYCMCKGVCVSLHHAHACCPWRPEEGVGNRSSRWPWVGAGGWTLGPLEEPVLLTAEPYLQPRSSLEKEIQLQKLFLWHFYYIRAWVESTKSAVNAQTFAQPHCVYMTPFILLSFSKLEPLHLKRNNILLLDCKMEWGNLKKKKH